MATPELAKRLLDKFGTLSIALARRPFSRTWPGCPINTSPSSWTKGQRPQPSSRITNPVACKANSGSKFDAARNLYRTWFLLDLHLPANALHWVTRTCGANPPATKQNNILATNFPTHV